MKNFIEYDKLDGHTFTWATWIEFQRFYDF